MGRARENRAVLLLDLILPKINGLELLQQIESDGHLKMISGSRAEIIARRKDMAAI